MSSYNDFEYTRQAIQLGVKDYISKYELEPKDLFHVLNELTFSEEQLSNQNVKQKAPFEADQWALEKQKMIDHSLLDSSSEQAFPLWDQLCTQAGAARIRWITLVPLPREGGYSPSEYKAMVFLAEEMFARLRNPIFLGESQLCLQGIRLEAEDETELQAREACERMASEWVSAFAHNLNITLKVFYGPAVDGMNNWHRAHQAAMQLQSMSFYRDDHIYFYEQNQETGEFSEEEWVALHKKLRLRIQFLQFEVMANELIELLADGGERRYPKEWIRLFRLAASQLADELMERFQLEAGEIREYFGTLWPFPESITQAQSRQQLITLLRQMTEQSTLVLNRRQLHTSWVNRVKEYVGEHYATTIRLEDAADFVNFSVNHFSQRFRQETGEAFTDYLTRIRIKEAARLYRETELSTEEIADRVGYSNANYFVKVFKKTTGQTVKAFKKEH